MHTVRVFVFISEKYLARRPFLTTEKTNLVDCLVQFVEHLEDNGHGQKDCLETFASGFSEGHKNRLVNQI